VTNLATKNCVGLVPHRSIRGHHRLTEITQHNFSSLASVKQSPSLAVPVVRLASLAGDGGLHQPVRLGLVGAASRREEKGGRVPTAVSKWRGNSLGEAPLYEGENRAGSLLTTSFVAKMKGYSYTVVGIAHRHILSNSLFASNLKFLACLQSNYPLKHRSVPQDRQSAVSAFQRFELLIASNVVDL